MQQGWRVESESGGIIRFYNSTIPASHDLGDRIFVKLDQNAVVGVKHCSDFGNFELAAGGKPLLTERDAFLTSLGRPDCIVRVNHTTKLIYSAAHLVLWLPENKSHPISAICLGSDF